MARPLRLRERFTLRVFRTIGQVGLGGLLTRFYLWMLASAPSRVMALVFAGYTPTKADVFVCTVSKSGTNWMMQIVTQIADRGNAQFDSIHDVVPWPEAPVPSQVAPLDTPVRSATGLRAIKTHVPAEHVPYAPEARYIVVVRDPKDVVVSSHAFVTGIIDGIWGAPPTLDDWVRRFVEKRFPLGSWAEHTAGWWALRDRPNVHVVRFRELKSDLAGEVDRIAAFLGVQLAPDERDAVVEKSTFAWMKAHDSLFETPVPSFGDRAVMIREGRTGSASSVLTGSQRDDIDRVCREALAALGSDFPYDTVA
ncbi:MAG: sulfotransferase domain-containing protein [Myxococcota bacterium]